MPRSVSSFLGPMAPWLDDEGDDYIYTHTLSGAAERLKRGLRERIARLDGGDLDAMLLEIRLQIAESAVTGHVTRAGDLHDLVMELLAAQEEHSKRL